MSAVRSAARALGHATSSVPSAGQRSNIQLAQIETEGPRGRIRWFVWSSGAENRVMLSKAKHPGSTLRLVVAAEILRLRAQNDTCFVSGAPSVQG